jgi:predicted metal-dependent phosphoesterase TrpH
MPGERAVDLHTHSTASDGRLAPAELVQLAATVGVGAIGLTDHDTTSGLAEAEAEAARLGLIVVPGVELSASYQRREAHMLGYFIDRENEEFQERLATFVRQRSERIDLMIERLAGLGIRVDREAVLAKATGGTVGRPHLAWTLIEMGIVSDITEAFDQYLAAGRPGYVPRPYLSPEDAIRLIRSAGGAPVLAHPRSTGDPAGLVAQLKPVGLAGMEVWYGEYSPEQREELHQIALANDLIPSGGSDFHAEAFKPGRDLGQPPVPWETIDRLHEDAVSWNRA